MQNMKNEERMTVPPLGIIGRQLLRTRGREPAPAPRGNADLVKIAFNTVDRQRLTRFGPDRVCAEWVIRNGGSIRWHGAREMLSDYSKLQTESSTSRKYLEEIDASGSSIMHYGFLHLRGVTRLRRMVISRCVHVKDNSLPMLILVRNSLKSLEVTGCENITSRGIYSLGVLIHLNKLVLGDLPAFIERLSTLTILQRRLPRCTITYDGMKH